MEVLDTFLSLLLVFVIINVIRFKRNVALFYNYFAKRYNKRMHARKKILFEGLNQLKAKRGDGRVVVLEVGSGGGANFEFFPSGSDVICLDPNRHFKGMVFSNVSKYSGIRLLEFHQGAAENMRELVKSDSVDAAVCTLVLGSVKDLARALQEILRVLKPVSRPTIHTRSVHGNRNSHSHGIPMGMGIVLMGMGIAYFIGENKIPTGIV